MRGRVRAGAVSAGLALTAALATVAGTPAVAGALPLPEPTAPLPTSAPKPSLPPLPQPKPTAEPAPTSSPAPGDPGGAPLPGGGGSDSGGAVGATGHRASSSGERGVRLDGSARVPLPPVPPAESPESAPRLVLAVSRLGGLAQELRTLDGRLRDSRREFAGAQRDEHAAHRRLAWVLENGGDGRMGAARRAVAEAEYAHRARLTGDWKNAVSVLDRRFAALWPQVRRAQVAVRAAAPADRALQVRRTVRAGALGERIRTLSARLHRSGQVVQGTGRFVRPGDGPVTSPFGPRRHPILGYVRTHTGLDLGAGDGVIRTVDTGRVLLTATDEVYGLVTVVHHGTVRGHDLVTVYAHQSSVGVADGEVVRRGEPIGRVGSTGWSTGPHLHVEVRLDGSPVDPGPWVGLG